MLLWNPKCTDMVLDHQLTVFTVPHFRTQSYQSSFFPHILSTGVWNDLPAKASQCDSLVSFKICLHSLILINFVTCLLFTHFWVHIAYTAHYLIATLCVHALYENPKILWRKKDIVVLTSTLIIILLCYQLTTH